MEPRSRQGDERIEHPSRVDLESFMRGELPRREVAGIVRHLLPGCARCTAITAKLWRLGEEVPRRGTKARVGHLAWQVGVRL
jgi:hypothetical protein